LLYSSSILLPSKSYAHADVEGVSSIGFVSGAGAALNCMMPLVNTVGMDNLVKMDNVGLHRSRDPGVGAFTPFYDRQLIARGFIPPGDELFDRYVHSTIKSFCNFRKSFIFYR